MTSIADWQTRVGDVWAAEWRRTDRSLADLSSHLDAAILAAAPSARATVLDIGCGAGATSAALAAARPDLSITGVDLSPALVEIAGDRVPTAAFHVGDAAGGVAGQGPFDLLVSRHGVMFFADPVAAFARLHAVAAPGARLVFSCFRGRTRNAFAGALVEELTGTRPPLSTAPGPFAFAEERHVASILAAAGWQDAASVATDFAYVAGEGADPVADAVSFLSRIGPLASIVAADPAAMRSRLTAALARYVTATRVVLPASAWIWRATKGPS
ncbi:class I SAM-dependent methyltransferase [Sphingomonas rubra]|uniref:Methyltransferase domain-containing protein n=1 Tax=Sphingomonas rubra TaxID=634430 RepID=A0A1I5PZD9_9SPHN|nr:class I SAM-dependent methyltransferase [Sphingomonas rubra]SFP39307.1 Methyltransferase domain-containing protein [Sphingomonas rubra]